MHVPPTQPVAAGMRGLGSTHLRWARRVCCTGEWRATATSARHLVELWVAEHAGSH